ncbi:hypothetical protein [Helicobacter sp. 13S00482-2]|uniref:hypothetical protein n=1 Tax=Helicobacter sp. 13S00482-2 TaxID=1476200 RepID=UPI0015D9F626|nr:hypothetical protein [Helicobacter sp. 13S00482-2]
MNLNDINLIIYNSLFIPALFIMILLYEIASHFTTFKQDTLSSLITVTLIVFVAQISIYYLLFLINIIIRARSFIKKRRNKIKEENPHDEPKNPETVKILENVIKQRRGE